MSDLEPVYAQKFNYWEEIRPAMTDSVVEAAMVMRLVKEDRLGLTQAQKIVHDIIHVAKHYMVAHGPAPLRINPVDHEQTK